MEDVEFDEHKIVDTLFPPLLPSLQIYQRGGRVTDQITDETNYIVTSNSSVSFTAARYDISAAQLKERGIQVTDLKWIPDCISVSMISFRRRSGFDGIHRSFQN